MSLNSEFDALSPFNSSVTLSRFDAFFDAYGLSLKKEADLEQRTITLIARSPSSAPAKALAINLARFLPLSIEVNIVFAQIAPADELEILVRSLAQNGCQSADRIIRWARNRALHEAHERLTLGRTLCWTGDAMRRSEDSRPAFDQVADGTPAILSEANASFSYLWRASKPLPKTLFTPRMPATSLPAYAPAPAPAPASLAPMETGLSLEADIVRLEDYFRFRRH